MLCLYIGKVKNGACKNGPEIQFPYTSFEVYVISSVKYSGLPQYFECENSWLFHDYPCPKLAIFMTF